MVEVIVDHPTTLVGSQFHFSDQRDGQVWTASYASFHAVERAGGFPIHRCIEEDGRFHEFLIFKQRYGAIAKRSGKTREINSNFV